MVKKALISGITGQDGAYLAHLLLQKGYEVHGIKRRSSVSNTSRIDYLFSNKLSFSEKIFLHHGDMTDSSSLLSIVQKIQPDEIYNLAAQSHVAVSFEEPEYTADSNALGTLRLLEAIRILNLQKKSRFYQASTSELFGSVQEIPQNENTRFCPRSPYAVAKLYAYWITVNYRNAYGMYACNGILFNHESPMREETFVTRKITLALARIVCGLQECLYLGNLDAKRDWGHARDYVEVQWLMLQQKEADDFVIATGEQHKIRDFVNAAAEVLGMYFDWQKEGVKEVGILKKIVKSRIASFDNSNLQSLIGKSLIRVDASYFRPTEVDTLLGDSTKARKKFGWSPATSFKELVEEMVSSDLKLALREKANAS